MKFAQHLDAFFDILVGKKNQLMLGVLAWEGLASALKISMDMSTAFAAVVIEISWYVYDDPSERLAWKSLIGVSLTQVSSVNDVLGELSIGLELTDIKAALGVDDRTVEPALVIFAVKLTLVTSVKGYVLVFLMSWLMEFRNIKCILK